MTEPKYLEPDRRSEPLIGVNPNPSGGESTVSDGLPSERSEQQRQQHSILLALTQVLTPLGVRFKFAIQRHLQPKPVSVDQSEHTRRQSPDACQPLEYRLWVICHAPKSLDCQLIAEPLAQALRQLDLQVFQDAIVEFSQSAAPSGIYGNNWRLKLDLAPPTTLLKNWARWGDVQAIVKLLNVALAPQGIQVSAVLKNLTLQIFCTLIDPQAAEFPEQNVAIDSIAPILIELAPQGIQGVTIQGRHSQPGGGGQVTESPAWMRWLDLPALDDPKFSPTPMILAARGDKSALKFVLERLLNPDLEQYFVTGGISLSLIYRQQLLYVMSEAVNCPIQSQVATTVVRVLRQLAISGIKGVRVYGRRSGESTPSWTDGVDFQRAQLALPPAAPEQQFVAPEIVKIDLVQRLGEYLAATGIWTHQIKMTNTNQLVYRSRFQWQPSILLLLIGLGVAIVSDLAMRFALETRHLTITQAPPTVTQLSFNNPLLEQQLAQYQLRCSQHGVPDVLIVGSSRALRGVNPAVLRRSLIDRGYVDPKIYNFGINGATARVVDLVLRQLLTPQQLPKLVIWADGARAFNSGRADRTYEMIAASERYQHLTSMSEQKNHSNSSILQVQSSVKNTYQAIDNQIDREFAHVSSAYERRDRLKTWLQSKVKDVSRVVDSNNDALARPASTNERGIDLNGFLAIDVQFDPATYYDRYAKVSGDSDGDYLNFQLAGSQDRALRQVTNLLAARKIPLIFVNMPLSDFYLDKVRRQHEITFKRYMHKLMASRQLTFVDLDGFLNKQFDRFSDPSHLNQIGASEVSRYLAQTTLIPW